MSSIERKCPHEHRAYLKQYTFHSKTYTVRFMGIVKVSDDIHEQLRIASKVFDRSLNAQAEHWLKIGMLSEVLGNKNYSEIRDFLFQNDELTLEKIIAKRGRSDSSKKRK